MAERLHLSPRHRSILEALLHEHLPDVETWAYGSRVNGRSHNGSDLDLALRGPGLKKIPAGQLADFRDAVRESTIPFLVEARDWAKLPERFYTEIELGHVVLCGRQAPAVPRSHSRPRECIFGSLFAEPTRNGLTRPKAVRGSGVKMVNMGELFAHNRLRDVAMDRVPLDLSRESQFLLRDGDLLFARQSLILEGAGKCSIFLADDEPTTFESHVIRVRLDQSCADPLYYYYYWQSHSGRSAIRSIVEQGAGASGIRASDLAILPVLSHPIAEQRSIADMLGTLDDKIELNRRMNDTLEAMARALFESWFVDFEPVRAKIEGRHTGLPKPIAALFPDALDDGGKPEGWTIGTLAEIANSPRRGVSPSVMAESTPYIGLEHMPRHSIALTKWEGAGKVTSSKSVFKKGEFLFGKLRPYFHKVGIAPLDGICSTDIVVVTPRSSEWAAFALSCLSSDDFVEYTDQTSTGTKMPRTNWKTMSQYEIYFPPTQVVRTFQGLVQPLIDRMNTNIHQSRSLAQIRDLLLPKLMTGEVCVPQAEKAVAAVL